LRASRAGSTSRRPVVPLPEGLPRGARFGRRADVVYPVARLVQTVRLEDREPFVTADGSSIREIAGVSSGNAVNQSLAEATVPPGAETIEHFHRASEEIYHFTAGAGRMRLGGLEADVRAGDTVVIAPGVPHKLWNTGDEPLVLLCCCSPPYSHEDTVLLED
jgi:mannose-6-phosphate isomerase-like protein (cupin superfamily)